MVDTAVVRLASPRDREQWEALFGAYRVAAGLSADGGVADRLWRWILDASSPVEALVVEEAEGLLGFAHFRRFPRPILADEGLYLDDLFTSPHARGRGVARALLDRLVAEVQIGGLATLRWTTRPSNTSARRLYERYGSVADAVTYTASVRQV